MPPHPSRHWRNDPTSRRVCTTKNRYLCEHDTLIDVSVRDAAWSSKCGCETVLCLTWYPISTIIQIVIHYLLLSFLLPAIYYHPPWYRILSRIHYVIHYPLLFLSTLHYYPLITAINFLASYYLPYSIFVSTVIHFFIHYIPLCFILSTFINHVIHYPPLASSISTILLTLLVILYWSSYYPLSTIWLPNIVFPSFLHHPN